MMGLCCSLQSSFGTHECLNHTVMVYVFAIFGTRACWGFFDLFNAEHLSGRWCFSSSWWGIGLIAWLAGLEYANMFAKLGAKVVVVEFMENILQMLDVDLKAWLTSLVSDKVVSS